jgi:hypothetical protein
MDSGRGSSGGDPMTDATVERLCDAVAFLLLFGGVIFVALSR